MSFRTQRNKAERKPGPKKIGKHKEETNIKPMPFYPHSARTYLAHNNRWTSQLGPIGHRSLDVVPTEQQHQPVRFLSVQSLSCRSWPPKESDNADSQESATPSHNSEDQSRGTYAERDRSTLDGATVQRTWRWLTRVNRSRWIVSEP